MKRLNDDGPMPARMMHQCGRLRSSVHSVFPSESRALYGYTLCGYAESSIWQRQNATRALCITFRHDFHTNAGTRGRPKRKCARWHAESTPKSMSAITFVVRTLYKIEFCVYHLGGITTSIPFVNSRGHTNFVRLEIQHGPIESSVVVGYNNYDPSTMYALENPAMPITKYLQLAKHPDGPSLGQEHHFLHIVFLLFVRIIAGLVLLPLFRNQLAFRGLWFGLRDHARRVLHLHIARRPRRLLQRPHVLFTKLCFSFERQQCFSTFASYTAAQQTVSLLASTPCYGVGLAPQQSNIAIPREKQWYTVRKGSFPEFDSYSTLRIVKSNRVPPPPYRPQSSPP